MKYVIELIKNIFKAIYKAFNRDNWLKVYNIDTDMEVIHALIEDGIITDTTPHRAIGRGIDSILGRGPYEKVVIDNEIIIRTPSQSEELIITPFKIVYRRQNKRMDGTYKFRIILTRNPLSYNAKSSTITPGYMKVFMEQYLSTYHKYKLQPSHHTKQNAL